MLQPFHRPPYRLGRRRMPRMVIEVADLQGLSIKLIDPPRAIDVISALRRIVFVAANQQKWSGRHKSAHEPLAARFRAAHGRVRAARGGSRRAVVPSRRHRGRRTGNLFIADIDNHRIRKVSVDGIITTLAGNGVPGLSGNGGPSIDAQFYLPTALTVDRKGNLFILNLGNTYAPPDAPGVLAGDRVRRVSPDGMITTAPARAHRDTREYAPT